jgi:hypothetical protein
MAAPALPCAGRGTCSFGFCHCQAGWFGKDCSRSKAWGPPGKGHEQAEVAGSRSRLRVYVYELPTWLAFEDEPRLGFNQHDAIYTAYQFFYMQLLKVGGWQQACRH